MLKRILFVFQVFVDVLTVSDYKIILSSLFPTLTPLKVREESVIDKIITFNSKLCDAVADGKIGIVGGPWELNLRDLTRWAQGIVDHLELKKTGKYFLYFFYPVFCLSLIFPFFLFFRFKNFKGK